MRWVSMCTCAVRSMSVNANAVLLVRSRQVSTVAGVDFGTLSVRAFSALISRAGHILPALREIATSANTMGSQ